MSDAKKSAIRLLNLLLEAPAWLTDVAVGCCDEVPMYVVNNARERFKAWQSAFRDARDSHSIEGVAAAAQIDGVRTALNAYEAALSKAIQIVGAASVEVNPNERKIDWAVSAAMSLNFGRVAKPAFLRAVASARELVALHDPSTGSWVLTRQGRQHYITGAGQSPTPLRKKFADVLADIGREGRTGKIYPRDASGIRALNVSFVVLTQVEKRDEYGLAYFDAKALKGRIQDKR